MEPEPPGPDSSVAAPTAGGPGVETFRTGSGEDSWDGSCKYLHEHFDEISARATGEGGIPCVEVTIPPPSENHLQSYDLNPDAFDLVAHPKECEGYTDWVVNRTAQCKRDRVNITIFEQRTKVVLGTLNVNRRTLSYTNAGNPVWGVQTTLSLAGATGVGYGASVRGLGTCGSPQPGEMSECTPNGPNTFGPSPALNPNFPFTGETYYRSTKTGPGQSGSAKNTVDLTFTNPKWQTPEFSSTFVPHPVRCDNVIKGRGPGCVVPSHTPAIAYSRTGDVSELARHIGDAQASGLPGTYPSGPPLTRLMDKDDAKDNRGRACPRTYTRPAGLSCDEYPFASSYQGAEQAPKGPGRTFPYCQVADLRQGIRGATGYSSCMINDAQNKQGGSQLSAFFSRNRVIDRDAYRVWIQP
ncbi:hypothetical protein [Pseudonocardia sp. ICBG1293]|uniref:NucA/NucB deoxyribonuclease domain-containing protein n=1 Tax=Pseudonocardia sp. ICBG1293 TaxID=2844382 RepID=UPI001CC93DFE|nr:hypothetical protein [Pseudonocardia sp. ICBG1293]